MLAITPLDLPPHMAGSFPYLGTALFAAVAAIPPRIERVRNRRRHWVAIAGIFLTLAALRVTGVEQGLHEMALAASRTAGTYGDRRSIQIPLLIILLGLALLAFTWAVHRLARAPRPVRISGCATIALMTYTAIRAVSFHNVDSIVYARLGPLQLNHIIEAGLSALVAWASWKNMRPRRKIRSNRLAR